MSWILHNVMCRKVPQGQPRNLPIRYLRWLPTWGPHPSISTISCHIAFRMSALSTFGLGRDHSISYRQNRSRIDFRRQCPSPYPARSYRDILSQFGIGPSCHYPALRELKIWGIMLSVLPLGQNTFGIWSCLQSNNTANK